MLGRKLAVRRSVVARHAEDRGAAGLDALPGITKCTGFARAARRAVLWIKIEHDGSPAHVGQAHARAVLIAGIEGGSGASELRGVRGSTRARTGEALKQQRRRE